MITISAVLGWIAIGAAASLAGMILPFRRGLVGILMNLLAGVAGAVLAPFFAIAVVGARPDRPLSLLLSAAGAIIALGIAHIGWAAATTQQPRLAPARRR